MKNILNNIKSYFSKDREDRGEAPVGTCPICWGRSEWDGHHYELQKDKHFKKDGDIYNTFINKIVEVHVNTTHKHEDKYICTTCDKEIV
jgi:hypothetical protein